jgi:hypothetical protein
VQNTGPDCVLELPKVIGFADSTGAFQAVEVPIGNVKICKKASPDHQVCNYISATSLRIKSGQTVTIELGAQWQPSWLNFVGQTPQPCADAISDVTRAKFPLASGSISIEWDIAFGEVCTSPSNVSVGVTS